MLSRVVPEMSDVITLFSPQSKLTSVDFPAFGFPTIAVLIPDFKIEPLSELAISLFKDRIISSIFFSNETG